MWGKLLLFCNDERIVVISWVNITAIIVKVQNKIDEIHIFMFL
jgi:hypothetical protein